MPVTFCLLELQFELLWPFYFRLTVQSLQLSVELSKGLEYFISRVPEEGFITAFHFFKAICNPEQ